jgi:iron-sulfur cluster assembly accessory protein
VLDFADSAQADDESNDEIIEMSPLVNVAVAADATDLLRNTEIDYVMEGVNGIIKYNNPNVVDECGCGESFNVG